MCASTDTQPGACATRSATVLENTWQVSMCRWRSSGRFARGGLRGTGSTGTMIRVGFGADDDGQGAEGLLGKKQDLPEMGRMRCRA